MKKTIFIGVSFVLFVFFGTVSVHSQGAPEDATETPPLKKSEQRFLNRLDKMGLGGAELTDEQKSKIRNLYRVIQRKRNAVAKMKTEALKEGQSTEDADRRKKAVDDEFKAKLDEILTPGQSQIRTEILSWRSETKADQTIDPAKTTPVTRVIDGVAFQPKKSATQQKKENAFKQFYNDRIGDNLNLTSPQEESIKKILFDIWTKQNQSKLTAFEKAAAKRSDESNADNASAAMWEETDRRLSEVLAPEQFKGYRINWIYSKLVGKTELDDARKAQVRQIAADLYGQVPPEAVARRASGEQAEAIRRNWKVAQDAAAAISNNTHGKTTAISQAERRNALAKALSKGLDLDKQQQVQVRKIATDIAKKEAESGLASTETYKNTYQLASKEAVERLMAVLTPEQQAKAKKIHKKAATKAKEARDQWAELGLASVTLTPEQQNQIEQLLEETTARKQAIKEARAKAAETGSGDTTAFQQQEKAANEALKTSLNEILTPAQRLLRAEALAKINQFKVIQTIGSNADADDIKNKSATQLKKEQEYLRYYQARAMNLELTPEQEPRFKEIINEGWRKINMSRVVAQEKSTSGKADGRQQILKIQEEMDNRVSALLNPLQFAEYKINCIAARLVDKGKPTEGQRALIRSQARTLWRKIRTLPPESTINPDTSAGNEHEETLRTAWAEGYQAVAAIMGTPRKESTTPNKARRQMAIARELSRDMNLTVEQQAQIRILAADVAQKEAGRSGKPHDYSESIPAEVSGKVMEILNPEQRGKFTALRQTPALQNQ